MNALPLSHPRYTVEEYFELEKESDIRYEFYSGEVFAMAGTTVTHNLLVDRVKDLLKAFFRPKGCNVFSENIKVEVIRGLYYPYPDVIVACHPFDLRGTNLMVRQPRILVEVLSASTAEKDRGFKWRQYRKLPSLWYYVLVDQYAAVVELFSRREETDEWINTVYEHWDDRIEFSRLGFGMTLGEIYEGIDLSQESEEMSPPE
ncbi:Uma2 family endonuclease [Tellurirhabdus rosea]|uniref:Uma2 family endonuclease n=1 Tax=Tellurirhabdus rosea TaxID=2674997 RepID=UPI002251FC63|nr:Uma2 family endonuclease [Tellurirhabdus rosea]